MTINKNLITHAEVQIKEWLEVETAHAAVHPHKFATCEGPEICRFVRLGSVAEDEMLASLMALARTGEDFTLNVVLR